MINTMVKSMLISVTLISCAVSNKNHENSKINTQNILGNKLKSEIIVGKVIKIDSIDSVYEIMISNNKTHKVLSKKVKYKPSGWKILKVGSEYKFHVVQLTHQNMNQNNMNGIPVTPTYYISDCVTFNGIEFCSDSWEVYEGKNIVNLYIHERD